MELAAAALAGVVVIIIADFLFLNSNTANWFAPSLAGTNGIPTFPAVGGGTATTTATSSTSPTTFTPPPPPGVTV